MHSFICLSTDIDQVEIAYILSNEAEVKDFRKRLNGIPACGRQFHRWPVDPEVDARPHPKFHLYNMYDLLPMELARFVEKEDTTSLHGKYEKFKYQSIKKMTAAYELDFDWAWWLDSEAIAVQPFSFRAIMDMYVKEPIVWRSRNAQRQTGYNIMPPTARVLGRSPESFGELFWNLEE
jgi:hypothetical protein